MSESSFQFPRTIAYLIFDNLSEQDLYNYKCTCKKINQFYKNYILNYQPQHLTLERIVRCDLIMSLNTVIRYCMMQTIIRLIKLCIHYRNFRMLDMLYYTKYRFTVLETIIKHYWKDWKLLTIPAKITSETPNWLRDISNIYNDMCSQTLGGTYHEQMKFELFKRRQKFVFPIVNVWLYLPHCRTRSVFNVLLERCPLNVTVDCYAISKNMIRFPKQQQLFSDMLRTLVDHVGIFLLRFPLGYFKTVEQFEATLRRNPHIRFSFYSVNISPGVVTYAMQNGFISINELYDTKLIKHPEEFAIAQQLVGHQVQIAPKRLSYSNVTCHRCIRILQKVTFD